MSFNWMPFAISAGLSLFKGWNDSNRYKQAGQAYLNAAYANAADLLHYTGLNADLLRKAAHHTAGAIANIGEANAAMIERITARNMALYRQQADEEVRRHVIGEKMVAGGIRAMTGASGLMTNVGTPLRYLETQVNEGMNQRQFMINKHKETLLTMKMEGEEKANIYRLTAHENAGMIIHNAEAQIGVMMNDAMRQQRSMLWQADLQAQQYKSQASSSFWGGILGAVGAGFTTGAFKEIFNSNPAGGTVPMYLSKSAPAYSPPATQFTTRGGIDLFANEFIAGLNLPSMPASYSGQLPNWFKN